MRKTGKKYYSFESEEDLNPMNYMSNLTDVMMILAVGIMLALVLHWNVPISTPQESGSDPSGESAVEFSEEDLEQTAELPEDMEKAGEVYYDPETGSYYIVYSES